MTPKELQKILKTGFVSGGYLFFGEEEYLKRRYLEMLRKVVTGEEEDPLNHVKIEADRGDFLEKLENEICSLPMFAEKKLVELHSLCYSSLSPGQAEQLAELCAVLKDHEECVLVLYASNDEFDGGRLPKAPSPIYKKLSPLLTPVEFRYESTAGLCGWVCKHFSGQGLICSPMTATALIDFCSRDMYTLSEEIKKLGCYTLSKGKKEVDPGDIPYVCCGKSIDGAFDFTDALLAGAGAKAIRLLSGMKARRERPENILGGVVDTLTGMFSVKAMTESGMRKEEISAVTGLHLFRVEKFREAASGKSLTRLKKALELCMEADMKIKSSGINNYTVLDRLVARLCRL